MRVSTGLLARLSVACLAGAVCWPLAARAADPTTPPAANPASATPATSDTASANPASGNPVLATVDGHPIHLQDVEQEAAGLPPNLRGVPPQTLYPMLLNRMIDARALVIQARREKLEQTPAVQKQIAALTDQVLENALLTKEVAPQITEAALKAKFDKTMAGKPGAEEVHARHILVPTKQEAEKIIAQLNKGANFAALAKKYSKDPGAADGGDLGFFKKDEMVPAFADAAFALKPGEYTKTPVHTQFGWHVIQVLGRRRAPAPTFAQAEPALRQQMLKNAVEKAVAKARAAVKVTMVAPPTTPDSATPAPK
ncbi:MAG: peptidylprolyl isomerase [Proteobacteria bacterium]|nr:peptidylprolyl isomerase [Pseudomonadota bacterium]